MNNNLVEIKLVNEQHLTIGERFIKRIQGMLQNELNIKGYEVHEATWASTETIQLDVGNNTTLTIKIEVRK
jgi:hypothetical protein